MMKNVLFMVEMNGVESFNFETNEWRDHPPIPSHIGVGGLILGLISNVLGLKEEKERTASSL